jgi:hypothetical protein
MPRPAKYGAANDPSMDPMETRLLRHTLTVALVAGTAVLAFIGWLLTL